MNRVEFAPRKRMEVCEGTARQFFRAVLDLEYLECLVTDESRLVDFSSCGMPDDLADATKSLDELYGAWETWVVPLIFSRYGLTALPTDLLVELFERIDARQATADEEWRM